MIDRVELESLVGFKSARDDRVEFRERPAINLLHLVQCDSAGRRVEAVEVAEREARSIANLAIGVGDALQDFLRAAHVLLVVRRDDPEAKYVRARLADE